MITNQKNLKWLIALGCAIYCLILYLPLMLKGGIIVDDWGNIASTLTCSGFFDCYRQNFAIFANRPLAPLSITLLTHIFGQHYTAYLVINTVIFLVAIGITSYVIFKITDSFQALIFGALACAPFIAMPIVTSPINQSTASISIFYWSLSLISTYIFCKRSQVRFLWISFVFLLASFLTYEITLPLVIFLMLFPLMIYGKNDSLFTTSYISKFVLPVLGVLLTSLIWQKLLGPLFIEIPTRLNFEFSSIIPQFLAWASIFYEGIPHLIRKSFSYSTPSAYVLTILFLLLVAISQKLDRHVQSRSKYFLFFLITLMTFVASASLYVLSGVPVEIGGYGSRGLSSAWFSFALLIAGFSGIWNGRKHPIAIVLIAIFLFFSLRPFIASRNNYIQSWKLQNAILGNFLEQSKAVQIGPNSLVISNLPEFTRNNFNNETVFSTSWDFPAALRLLTNDQVSSGLVIDTRGGNFHSLSYQDRVLQADGFWKTRLEFPSKLLWAYEFNSSTSNGTLKPLKTELDLQNQLVSWGLLENLSHYSYINLNQKIRFDIPWEHRQNFILKGWYSEIESWGGIWSTDTQAIIRLPLPRAKAQSLELKALAFVSPQHPQQKMNFYINDQLQTTLLLSQSKDNHISIPIPNSAWNKSYLELKLDLPDAISPKALGMGNDERRLAIGLQSATYR